MCVRWKQGKCKGGGLRNRGDGHHNCGRQGGGWEVLGLTPQVHGPVASVCHVSSSIKGEEACVGLLFRSSVVSIQRYHGHSVNIKNVKVFQARETLIPY